MAFAEAVGQPGVDCAEAERACLCSLLDFRHVLEHPGHLGGREVGRECKTRAILHKLFCTRMCRLELVAECCSTAALPDDGTSQRLAGGPVPGKAGLALVRDAESSDVFGCGTSVFHHGFDAGTDIPEDLFRIMLDPALLIHILRVGQGGLCQKGAILLEEERLRALCGLVYCEDELSHRYLAAFPRSFSADAAMPSASRP